MSAAITLMLATWGLAVFVTLSASLLTRKHIRTSNDNFGDKSTWIPLSILKPLKGVDEGLEDNLESFFRQDYPQFEIILSVARHDDPARLVAERLLKRYPQVDAKVLVGEQVIGPNPKVNNMIRSYDQARYDLILISDSNVRVSPQYLKQTVNAESLECGVTSALAAGRSPQGLGGHLEALYLNTFISRGMVFASKLGFPCVLGKSMLFRKSNARRFGGLRSLSHYIAEDYMMGEAMRQLDKKVALMPAPIDQHIGNYSFKSFWDRHVRWGRIRKSQAPLAFAVELISNSIITGVIGALALHQITGLELLSLLIVHLGVCFAADVYVYQLFSKDVSISKLLPVWFLKEVLTIPLWIHTSLGNSVLWRGRWIELRAGGAIQTRSIDLNVSHDSIGFKKSSTSQVSMGSRNQ